MESPSRLLWVPRFIRSGRERDHGPKPVPRHEPFFYSLTIGATSYTVPCHIFPYFKAFHDFQTRCGSDLSSLHHSPVPYIDDILDVCTRGPLGRFFDVLPADICAYEVVSEQLDILMYIGVADIKTLPWRSAFPRVSYFPDGVGSTTWKTTSNRRERARESAFQQVYRILMDQSDACDYANAAQKAFQSVQKAVVPSKSTLLDDSVKNIVAAAYVRRFGVTLRQMALFKKYGLLEDDFGKEILDKGLLKAKMLKNNLETGVSKDNSTKAEPLDKDATTVAIMADAPP